MTNIKSPDVLRVTKERINTNPDVVSEFVYLEETWCEDPYLTAEINRPVLLAKLRF